MEIEAFEELGNIQNWKLMLGYGTIELEDPSLILLLKEKTPVNDYSGIHKSALIRISPFNPGIIGLWKLKENDEEIRKEILELTINAIRYTPTLFIPGTINQDPTNRIPLFIHIAACKANGEAILEAVKNPNRNPQKQVYDNSHHLDMFSKHPTPPLDYNKAKELVEIQLNPSKIQAEMQAFDYAYMGIQNSFGNIARLPYQEMHDLIESMIRGE